MERVSGMSRGEAQAAYNCVVALQDVSFDVHDGETFVVMGLSGSGKSTIVRCINRLINPTTGSVFVDDDDVLAFGDEELTNFRRTKTSMVFQQFGLLPHRTVLENAAWGLASGASIGPPLCPAACSSASAWPEHWPATRKSC